MEKIRVIIQSSKNGNKEQVIFTDKLEANIEKFKVSGLDVDSDDIIDNNLPDGFPTGYNLLNQSNMNLR